MSDPILVTGTHNSGSTWLGRMLSLPSEVGYIHEPFSPEKCVCKDIFKYWFTYVNEKNGKDYEESIRRSLSFEYNFRREIKGARSFNELARVFRDKLIFARNKFQKKRPLMKDPISLLSAKWLSDTFNMQVVVLIRHPAAFVGSLKKSNSLFPFDHFLSQKMLMEDHFSNYEAIIRKYAIDPPDLIDQAILLWNLFHNMILKYRYKNNDWLFYKHEDLSREPVEQFGEIYKAFDLDFSSSIKKKIKKYSSANFKGRSHLKRDSKSNIWSWKQRLTKREITRIREGTSGVADNFYTCADW